MSLVCVAALVLILAHTSVLAIPDIPSLYLSSDSYKSLLCNTCSVLSNGVQDALDDESADFETLVGFRLDSNGKKIRKQSDWLKLFLSIENACEDFKQQYRVAKRKNDHLYLITTDEVRSYDNLNSDLKKKLNMEASEKLRKIWDEEWQAKKERFDKEYNETGINPLEKEANATETDEDEKQQSDQVDGVQKYYYEKKPKMIKRKTKPDKLATEMCYFLFDEWLHDLQTLAKQPVVNDMMDFVFHVSPRGFTKNVWCM